jgi:cellulose synthase/poly-beta-1,6-N-acetylglucosamine synthase-like glycosyltransferase
MQAPSAQEPTADGIAAALRQISPRFRETGSSLRRVLIFAGIISLWVALTLAAWFAHGILAWATGLVYVAYDTLLLVYVASRTAFVLRQHSVPAGTAAVPLQATPGIGILIAAYNEAPALPTTLEALIPQLAADDVLLVVDDGSGDGTLAMLAARYPTVHVLANAHGGKALALNAGLAQLRTELVVTLDADTRLAPDALAALREAFAADPAMVAASCVIRPVCAPSLFSGLFQGFQTFEYVGSFCSRIAWMRADALLLVSGAFAGFRREALVRVGGFDPQCLVEDYELIHRLHRYSHDRGLGWRVCAVGTARAITDAPGSLPSFLRQRRRWFAGFLQTQYWNGDMTFNPRYGNVGRLMLPIKAFDTLQPVFGLTALVLLAGFASLGRISIFVPALLVLGAKTCIDVGFQLWWVHVYGRWTGQRAGPARLLRAALTVLAGPFSFQLLRQVGATWGWAIFLTGRHRWGVTASVPVAEVPAQ